MNKLKRFLSTTMVYLFGNVFSKLIVFFLLPLYTSRIAPEQYGTYDLVITLLNLLAPIAFFQIWDGMFRVSFDYETEEGKYKTINNSMIVCLIGTLIYLFSFSIIYSIIRFEYAIYVLVYGLLFSLHYMYGYVCRVFLANKIYAISGIISTFVTAVSNIILIVYFNWDVKSLYLAPAIGTVVQIIIVECRFKLFAHFKREHIEKSIIRKMIKFSIPLCIAAASYWLLSGFTKLLITEILGAADNGLFAIANRFATMVTLVVTIFQYAWNELAYLMADDDSRVNQYNICIDLLLKFVIIGSAAICILIKLVFPYLIHEQYAMAIYIIPATIIGSMMNAMAGFVGTLFMTEKKTNFIMYSTLISAGINIGLGILFTKLFGLHGATISLCIAFSILMIIRLVQSKRKMHIKINLASTCALLLVLAISVYIYYAVDSMLLDILALLAIGGIFILSIRKYITMFIGQMKTGKGDMRTDA